MPAEPEVALRAQTADDEAALYRIAADLDTFEERSPAAPAPLTLEAFREREGRASGAATFVITVDGTVAGRCTLFGEDPLARHAEVGIALLPEARGRGVGTAALRQLIEFGFRRRNVRRLHLIVIESNRAAIATYRKLGFVEEGRRREHCWVRGRYEDEVIMGLLRSEWEATTSAGQSSAAPA